MPGKAFAAFVIPLLPVLVLALPGRAVAGPPVEVSGKMVLDEVADGLRKYRKETDIYRRAAWLRRLALTRDPRVAIALGELIDNPTEYLTQVAAGALMVCYYPDIMCCGGIWQTARDYWHKNEADLRRRVKQLP